MGSTAGVGELEIEQDLAFTRRSWRIKRMAWVAMLLVALAGLLGLFGTMGPASQGRAGDVATRGLSIDYPRFARSLAPATLTVHVGPQWVRHGEIRLRLGRTLLAACRIESLTPEPEQTFLGPDHLLYVFPTSPGLDPPREVEVHLQPQRAGFAAGWIEVPGGPRLRFTTFVYP